MFAHGQDDKYGTSVDGWSWVLDILGLPLCWSNPTHLRHGIFSWTCSSSIRSNSLFPAAGQKSAHVYVNGYLAFRFMAFWRTATSIQMLLRRGVHGMRHEAWVRCPIPTYTWLLVLLGCLQGALVKINHSHANAVALRNATLFLRPLFTVIVRRKVSKR